MAYLVLDNTPSVPDAAITIVIRGLAHLLFIRHNAFRRTGVNTTNRYEPMGVRNVVTTIEREIVLRG